MARAFAFVTSVTFVASAAFAQPYAADGGFGRPVQVLPEAHARPALAAVADRGVATLARIAGGQLVIAPLEAPTAEVRVLAEGVQLRDVIAGDGRDATASAVYVWYERDLSTGRFRYSWHTDGATRTLFETPQIVEVRPIVGPVGPEAYVVRPTPGGGAVIELWRWSGTDDAPTVVLRSDLSLGGIDVGYDASGDRHLSYLEGFTEVGDLGVTSEWSANHLGPDGIARTLGRAAPPPSRVLVQVDPEPIVVWAGADGSVRAATPGADVVPLGPGTPAGATERYVVWRDGATIRALERPLGGAERANVAWSPLTIAGVEVVEDAEGVTHLVWLGTRVGRGFTLYASDDRRPMERTFTDRLAATMGWTPWSVAEEAAGQAAGALLVAVIVSIALLPLYWLLAAFLVRLVPAGAVRVAGALLATLPVVAILAVTALWWPVNASGLGAVVGLPFVTPLALLLGGAVAVLVAHRVDTESLQTVVLGATVGTFVITAVISFATFQHWLRLLTT